MIRRHKHNLSHFRNTTCNMGSLVPIGCIEVLHGDTFKHNTNMFMRLSPLVKPVMHPVHTHIHHIFVPYRILFEDWEDFITGGEDFNDASVMPIIDFSTSPVTAGSLANHLGLPVGYNDKACALPFRAYALIYNKIYRDDQLQDEVQIAFDGGEDSTTETDLLNVNWSKDPFVNARPDDQLGTEVSLPLGDSAPIRHGSGQGRGNIDVNTYDDDALYFHGDTDKSHPFYADLTSGTAATINELRLAIATQRWQEIINRSGNSYGDYLKRQGIKYSDGRLNEPEYLAGGKQTVQFSEVIQTGVDSTDGGVGDLKGHGIAAMRSNSYVRFFEEHGIVLSLLHVKPIPMYMQSLHKMWFRSTKEDFFQKEFEILGMQEILNKEVKFDHSSPDATFGYTERFNDYRRIPNTVHGQFADFNNTEMMSYHMARHLQGDVALNSAFCTCNPTNRNFADTSYDQLQLTVQHRLAARRLVSKYHKPGGLTL